jgi:hypothetical protein
MNYRMLLSTLFCLCSAVAHADGLAISAKAGFLGGGLELSKFYSEKVSGRLGLNIFYFHTTSNRNTANYDFDLKLQTVSALADWYPYAGIFRVSSGLMINRNRADISAQPNPGSSYTVNGTAYMSGSEIQSLNGSVRFNLIAPYIGVGWGNPLETQKKWGLVSDLGFMLQGSPKTNLDATCAPGYAGCANLQNDAAAERASLESSMSKFKLLPVLTIGASYRF